jgi:hypothetical protein
MKQIQNAGVGSCRTWSQRYLGTTQKMPLRGIATASMFALRFFAGYRWLRLQLGASTGHQRISRLDGQHQASRPATPLKWESCIR